MEKIPSAKRKNQSPAKKNPRGKGGRREGKNPIGKEEVNVGEHLTQTKRSRYNLLRALSAESSVRISTSPSLGNSSHKRKAIGRGT